MGAALGGRLLAAFLNGVIGLLWTRVLSPESFGQVSVVLLASAISSGVAFEWCRQAVFRIEGDPEISDGGWTTLILAFVLGGMALVVTWATLSICLPGQFGFGGSVFLIPGLAVSQSLFDVCTDRLIRTGRARAYALSMIGRALGIGVGGHTMVRLFPSDHDAAGVLLAVMLAGLGSVLWMLPRSLRQMRAVRLRPAEALPFCRYGVPLGGAVLLSFLSGSMSRMMLVSIAGTGALGAFTAVADPVTQVIVLSGSTLLLGAYPPLLVAHDRADYSDADAQFRRHGVRLVVLLGAVAVSLVAVGGWLLPLIVGPPFRRSIAAILPGVAAGVYLQVLRSSWLDTAFQVQKRTQVQTGLAFIVLIAGALIQYAMVARFGIRGAALGLMITGTVLLLLASTVVSVLGLRYGVSLRQGVCCVAVASAVLGLGVLNEQSRTLVSAFALWLAALAIILASATLGFGRAALLDAMSRRGIS